MEPSLHITPHLPASAGQAGKSLAPITIGLTQIFALQNLLLCRERWAKLSVGCVYDT